MVNLRIRACADGVVVFFVFVERESLVKRYIVPIANVTIPGCCYIPTGVIPDFSVFGMPACARARIGVKCANGYVVRRRYCSVMYA